MYVVLFVNTKWMARGSGSKETLFDDDDRNNDTNLIGQLSLSCLRVKLTFRKQQPFINLHIWMAHHTKWPLMEATLKKKVAAIRGRIDSFRFGTVKVSGIHSDVPSVSIESNHANRWLGHNSFPFSFPLVICQSTVRICIFCVKCLKAFGATQFSRYLVAAIWWRARFSFNSIINLVKATSNYNYSERCATV